MKSDINTLKSELEKIKFHNSCLLYLIGELRDNRKSKFPTMQEVCVLFDLSNDDLKIILKNIQSFDDDLDKFSKDTLKGLSATISQDSLFFIIKGVKNSTSGNIKKTCKMLLKLYKETKKEN